MEVGVDDVAHRLGGDFTFDLGNERRSSRWLGVGVYDDHVFGADENGGVAVDLGLGMRHGEEDAVGDLLQVEEIGCGAGSGSAGPGCAVPGKFENRRTGQGATHQDAKKIAAGGLGFTSVVIVRMVVVGHVGMSVGMGVMVMAIVKQNCSRILFHVKSSARGFQCL